MNKKRTGVLALMLATSLLALGLEPTGPSAAEVPPQQLAFNFTFYEMMNPQGGIYTQFQNFPNQDENQAKGHEVLLQNNALFMLYLVREGDKQLFDRQVSVIQDSFLENRLGLLHWKLDKNMRPILNAWGAYSNDPGKSLQVIEALFRAYDQWGDETYRELAHQIGQGLRFNLAKDQTLRHFTSWTPLLEIVGNADRVVLSQLDFTAMAQLAETDTLWREALRVNVGLTLLGVTDKGLIYFSYVPEGNRYESGSGSMIDMAQSARHLAGYGSRYSDPAATAAARRFLDFAQAEYQRQSVIFGRYDIETGTPLVNWENTAVYVEIVRVAEELGEFPFAQQVMDEKILPVQQRDFRSPVFGAFSPLFDDAYAFDTLVALLALPGLRISAPQDRSIQAVWYLGSEPDSYLSPTAADDLRQIQARLCPSHIGITAFVFQDGKYSTNPHSIPGETPSDEALRNVVTEIHRMGMKVILLTPLHVFDGTWEGDIRPDNVDAWFEGWREIILHYASLAEEIEIEVLLLGSELLTVDDETDHWRRLIREVRQRYSGKLSYSVNFWPNRDLFEKVMAMSYWSDLDYIGVTAYFELTKKTDPTLAELMAAWRGDRHGQDIVADVQSLIDRYGKPVIFWEMGYESKDGTNIRPWDFPEPGSADEGEQADAWLAFLQVFQAVPLFEGYGVFAENVGLPQKAIGYNVLGKRAEEVLRERGCRD